MTKKTLFLSFCFMMLVSCIDNHDSVLLPKKEFIQQIEIMYEYDCLTEHFPELWHNDAMELNKWSACYYRSDDCPEYPEYANYRLVGNFTMDVSDLIIDSLEKKSYEVALLFSDSTFMKLNIPYLTIENSFRNRELDSLMIPIYDFRDVDFNLGKVEDSIFFNGRYWYGEHNVTPSDLVVCVIDAKPGNFWKNKELADKEPRPVLPEKWKHGYSRGIGISRSCSRVCWWVMAW